MERNEISGLRKNYGMKLQIGLVISLFFVFCAFNYTVYPPEYQEQEVESIAELDAIPIRTKQPEKAITPPPKINISKEIKEVKQVEFVEKKPELIEKTIDADKTVPILEDIPQAPTKPKAKPKRIPQEPKVEAPTIVPTYALDELPRFNSCEGKDLSSDEKQTCALKAMKIFIAEQINYPIIARENNISGTAVIQFIIEKDGSISSPKILRDPGAGLGAEALRVINEMPNWVPGKQKGRKVRVRFNLPVKFRLG